MDGTNPKVDFFFEKPSKWQNEYAALRNIILDCGLTEELKWGVPCYTFEKRNILLIHGFKEYCAVLFHKGALLSDAKGVLIQQTKNVQSARQVRFTGSKEIDALSSTLKKYIQEAIAIERSGSKVSFKKTKEFEVPEEFQKRLDKNARLKKAFGSLTPGRQRGYLLHFSSAKQSKTREARIEKAVPRILEGKGIDD